MADCCTPGNRSLFVLLIANLAISAVTMSFVLRRPDAPQTKVDASGDSPKITTTAKLSATPDGTIDGQVALVKTDAQPDARPVKPPTSRSPIAQDGETITKPLPYVQAAVVPTTGVVEDAATDSATAKPAPVVEGVFPWTKAGEHVGQTITVEGRIVDTHATGTVCFLNFDKNWQDKFYLIIMPDAVSAWPEAPETYFLNKTLRVTGQVDLHKGRPQIKIKGKEQVVVVE